MRLKDFPVTVFGSVLGTGGVILASKPFVPPIVFPMTLLLIALFSIFTAILLVKAIKFPSVVKSELKHPLPGNFYALQPISAVIISMLCMKILPFNIDVGLLIYGAILILCLSVYLPYHFFSNMTVNLSQLHGGWFITPVATVLVTDAVLLHPLNELNIIVSLLFFGIGSLLFLLILAVLFFRLLSHELPPVELAPTNYIMLAPIGILIVDIVQISSHIGQFFGSDLTAPALIMSISLWGFGLWVALVNILMIVKYFRNGLRFHIGWWSYVFPTAAFNLATVDLSARISLFGPISLVLYVILVIIFVAIVVGSLRNLLKPGQRAIFKKRGPCRP